jgi:hypothetical protein
MNTPNCRIPRISEKKQCKEKKTKGENKIKKRTKDKRENDKARALLPSLSSSFFLLVLDMQ